MSNNRNQYFATLPKEDIGSELMKKSENWYENITMTGIFRKMKKSYAAYYGYNSQGAGHTASEVVQGGEQGELKLLKVNHLRNLLQHMLVMTTSTRPAMDARAINTDYRTIAQTILANGILDYYMREKRLERHLKTATEYALVFGEGFIRLEWDASLGDQYGVDPNTGRIIHNGDIKYTVLNPLDVIRDVFIPDNVDNDWIIVRHFKNRFELIAKYPEFEDEILGVDTKDDIDYTFNLNINVDSASDLIPIYEFYHRRSEALPEGRQVVYVSKDAVFYDGPLPYKDIPVYRIAPGDFIGTPHGYTVAFDLLSLQDTIDGLYSIIVTNQTTFGVQNILLPMGANITYSQLPGGMNVIEYDPTLNAKPEALQLTSTPVEIFNFVNKVEATMETISGVNSVARGNPEANLRSGNALALIQSMAIQFNSGLQQSYAQLIEDVGTATINTLRDFGSVARTVQIVGKNNRSMVKEFIGSDLDLINRVVVDVGNPLAKTTAGKLEMANNLLQQGLIKTPEQYIMVMKTGNWDTMLQGDTSELALIDLENEKLQEAEDVVATVLDNHILHIKEHKIVINSPEARSNPEIVQRTLAHIQEHINLWRSTDPDLLQTLGIPPLPPQQPQGPPQGPQGEISPEAMAAISQPQGGLPEDVSKVMPAMNAQVPPASKMPGMPSEPKNPLSGEKWNPQNGGL